MTAFEVASELRIGRILEVSGAGIRVELDSDLKELNKTYHGTVYSIGQIGSIIKIHFGRQVIFALVKLLRMRSELIQEQGVAVSVLGADSRILEADLFGEGIWRQERLYFERGLKTFPLPQQIVYIATTADLEHSYQGAERLPSQDGYSCALDIGIYANSISTVCRANADKLFGHHCAILGSSGSGKSATVAALVHSLLQNDSTGRPVRPNVIVIDPHGEYGRCFGNRAINYRAYDLPGDTEQSAPIIKLPYWLMTGSEFRSFIIGKGEHEATTQNNIVYRALAHARMVHCGLIKPAAVWVNKDESAGNPLDYEPIHPHTLSEIASFDRDLPLPFDLDQFVAHITEHQGVKVKNKKWERMSPTDFAAHHSILNKISAIRADPRIQFMISNHSPCSPSLDDVIFQLVGRKNTDDRDICVIDTSGLPNEVAGPLAALVARLLFNYKAWQNRQERALDPVVLVCEEAHRYVPQRGEAEYADAQMAIQRIAKEGRKYGLGLVLVSQRPADVDSTVISQCNTWIILRLTNATDQEYVQKFLPDHLAGMVRMLPSLARQEALFVGEGAYIPARIRVRDLESSELPDSNDILFMRAWRQKAVTANSVEAVVRRWQRRG